MENPRIQKLLVKPSEAAQMIGCSRAKMYELLASGAIKSVRLEGGRLIRVPVSALEALAQGQSPLSDGQK